MAVDPNIKKKADDIRTKIKGKEVREALASGIEDISGDVVQNEGRQSDVEQRQSTVEGRQTDVETRFDDQIAGNTDVDEVIDARRPEGEEAYPTLRRRLDDEHQEVTTQLTQNTTDLYSRGYNIQWSALEVESDDWTNVINDALSMYGHVFIDSKIEILGCIEVKGKQKLELGNNAELIKPARAETTSPVVWVKSSHASLVGAGLENSTIRSEKDSPNGVVAVGYLNMNDTEAKNVLYCDVKNFRIVGNGNKSEGNPNLLLNMSNPQVNGLASYFHRVENLKLDNGNIGVLLEGSANANIITNLQFINVGNHKYLNGGAFVFKQVGGKYPLDNVITNAFHHKSVSAITLVFDGQAYMNIITGISSEPGGSYSKFMIEIGTEKGVPKRNIISGAANNSGGFDTSEDFRDNNLLMLHNRVYGETSQFVNSTVKNNLTVGNDLILEGGIRNDYKREKSFNLYGITENVTYEILKIGIPSHILNRMWLLEVDAVFYGSVKRLIKKRFNVSTNGSGVITVSELEGEGTLITATVDGERLLINLTTPNNGTGTSSNGVIVDYKIVGERASRWDIEEVTQVEE